jgi:hypothetical protein
MLVVVVDGVSKEFTVVLLVKRSSVQEVLFPLSSPYAVSRKCRLVGIKSSLRMSLLPVSSLLCVVCFPHFTPSLLPCVVFFFSCQTDRVRREDITVNQRREAEVCGEERQRKRVRRKSGNREEVTD